MCFWSCMESWNSQSICSYSLFILLLSNFSRKKSKDLKIKLLTWEDLLFVLCDILNWTAGEKKKQAIA